MYYKRRTNSFFTGIPVLIMLFVILFFTLKQVQNSFKVNSVYNCKVLRLEQQQKITGSSSSLKTNIRYLVITDKETFVCESSIINGKFNNSDLFFRLKEGEIYSFKVEGYGKSILYDYRNILEVIK